MNLEKREVSRNTILYLKLIALHGYRVEQASEYNLLREEIKTRNITVLVKTRCYPWNIWTYNDRERAATHIRRSVASDRSRNRCTRDFLLSRRRGGGRERTTTLPRVSTGDYPPSACSRDRVLPPINRDEGRAAHFLHLYRPTLPCTLSLNKLYHDSRL